MKYQKNCKHILLIIILLVIAFKSGKAENFAFLCAGSNLYINYRHQADVCHAYQMLIKNDYKPENIIVMAYDDIANNQKNPIPGTLYNNPGSANNVYEGCVIDYWNKAVNPKNFIAILKGDQEGLTFNKFHNNRVLNTTEHDNIFLYFSDHGGPGLISFPPKLFASQMLFKGKLVKAFKFMFENKKYKKLAFYLESCYSGSMFSTLPDNIKVYALSASDSTQPSLAMFCPPFDTVDGVPINACLGDEFSEAWINNSVIQFEYQQVESLQQQYETVKKYTKRSTVMQWGDLSFTNDPINDFMSTTHYQNKQQNKNLSFFQKIKQVFRQQVNNYESIGKKFLGQISEVDGKISNYQMEDFYYAYQFKNFPSKENFEEFQQHIAKKSKFLRVFQQFQELYFKDFSDNQLKLNTEIDVNEECYENLINNLEKQCGVMNEYAQQKLTLFYKFCQNQQNYDINKIQFDC